MNTVVGSGTLITFPVLLSLGVPPVTANVSNTIGLVPGTFSGAYGYRRELAGQRDRLLRPAAGAGLGVAARRDRRRAAAAGAAGRGVPGGGAGPDRAGGGVGDRPASP